MIKKEHYAILISIILISIILNYCTPYANAHSPYLINTNTTLATAHQIEQPTKSWAIYGEIMTSEEANYFKLEMKQNELLYLTLYVPFSVSENISPQIVVFGEDFGSNDTLPSFIEKPPNQGYIIPDAIENPELEFEPFTQSALTRLVRFEHIVQNSGVYYVVVYFEDYSELTQEGKYLLAPGKEESFTPFEIFMLPSKLIEIYLWEGQNIWQIFAPSLIILFLALIHTVRNWKKHKDFQPAQWILIVASLGLSCNAANTALQIIIKSTIITPTWTLAAGSIFVIIPVILAIDNLRQVRTKPFILHPIDRFRLTIKALIAYIIWTGYYFAPIFLLIGAFLPNKEKNGIEKK